MREAVPALLLQRAGTVTLQAGRQAGGLAARRRRLAASTPAMRVARVLGARPAGEGALVDTQ